MSRARARARPDRALHRPPAARGRDDGLPRHHGPSRASRRASRRPVRATLGNQARRHRRRTSGAAGDAAGEPAQPRVGRGAQAAGVGRGPACEDDLSRTANIREGRLQGVTDRQTLNVGDSAPGFTLKTIGLKDVSLSDFRGKNVVILFYPLDWTSG
ncbi:MAG: hypothetical protein DMD97_14540 [Candidatus Rokuibacteriota bacterium]|nr:MAG: hypothetical protein DMD97_14540 [Candidatus Rokubacteria bacterium]